MVVEIRVQNFRSIRDRQTLSLVASSDRILPGNTFLADGFGKRRLVRSAVIYGKNASGKSNLIRAISFMRDFVSQSHKGKPSDEIPVQPFRLDSESEKIPTEFEITFIHEKIRYQYGFAVDRRCVRSEWLIAYPKSQPQKWFDRSWSDENENHLWYFGSHLKGEKDKLVQVTRQNALFISVAAQFNNPQLTKIFEWFQKHLRIIDARTSGQILEAFSAATINTNLGFRDTTRRLLHEADVGIDDFAIETRPFTADPVPDGMPDELRNVLSTLSQLFAEKNAEQIEVKTRHQTANLDQVVTFAFEEESAGTRRLFGLSGAWCEALENGDPLFVDELDASLHPLLSRMLVLLFHDAAVNPNNAQLVFNTHDTTLLDSALFRRDQIWFTEKDREGATHLYPLLDYSPRKGESLQKGYLQGRYGAIPFIGGSLLGFNADGKTHEIQPENEA